MANNAFTERWTVKRAGGLTGGTIHIAGLTATMTDVLVRLERLDGTTQVTRLTPSAPSFVVEAAPGALEVARTYIVLGVEHILTGIDHLLFVLALLIITRRRLEAGQDRHRVHDLAQPHALGGDARLRARAATAGRGGHRAEHRLCRGGDRSHAPGREGITARAPWVVAFTFGLMHGLGFAGGLSEVGLPAGHIPAALLFFSVGVETRPFPVHRRRCLSSSRSCAACAFRSRAGQNSFRPTPSAASRCSGSSNASRLFEHINERKYTTMTWNRR